MRISKIINLIATVLLISACNAENNFFEKASYESASHVSSLSGSDNSPSQAKSAHTNQLSANQDRAHQKIASTKNNVNTTTQVNDINIVASIGAKVISQKDLDARIQLSLFDLEWQKYQLRKEALHSLIFQETQANKIADQKAIITLIPPTPPRVGLPKDLRPIMGTPNAVVTIDIFCSYQSSHCARLYPTLSELNEKYSGMIGFRFFDYPQRFHRYGISAANAFRCVADYTQEKDKLWAFQSALYADINQLNHQRYMILAEQLELSSSEFERCLVENHHQEDISKDLAFGKQIGLGNVPVLFINGLYVKGAKPLDMYSFYIEQELSLMDHSKQILPSQLPITLLATTVSNIAEQSSAEIINQKNESMVRVKIGELIFPQTRIIDIQTNQILINNQGITEFIKIKTSQGHQLTDANHGNTLTNQNQQEALVGGNGDEDEILIDSPQRRTLPVTGEMTLSREWVDQQLLDQTALERHFYNAEHIVEGNHLIKLNNVDDQRFYTTLGLKTGDVIMRINDEWVHESQNPLWATLQKNESVTLTVMRKGLPYRYDYQIK